MMRALLMLGALARLAASEEGGGSCSASENGSSCDPAALPPLPQLNCDGLSVADMQTGMPMDGASAWNVKWGGQTVSLHPWGDPARMLQR